MYSDLESAGRHLADALANYRGANSVVVAIANGGVPVAIPVANSLQTSLELLIIRRLFMRDGKPVCAVSVGGDILLDPDSRPLSSIEEQFKQEALDQLAVRSRYMRSSIAAQNMAGLSVILVDNGIHTGSTVQTAINALRKLQPESITLAVPIADSSTKQSIESVADEVVCLQWCDKFGHTGLWYKNFTRPNDEQVRTMIRSSPCSQRYQLTIE